MNRRSITLFALIFLSTSAFAHATSPRTNNARAYVRFAALMQRDHLTEQEADLVRDAQEIDKRIDVMIRAVERRLLVLTDPQAEGTKQVQKEMEKWGPLPKGSRYDLFTDISKILDEAITNIDDASERTPSNETLNKALRKLSEASTRFVAQLETLRAGSRGSEREALDGIIENADSIIEAAKKLPPPVKKK